MDEKSNGNVGFGLKSHLEVILNGNPYVLSRDRKIHKTVIKTRTEKQGNTLQKSIPKRTENEGSMVNFRLKLIGHVNFKLPDILERIHFCSFR